MHATVVIWCVGCLAFLEENVVGTSFVMYARLITRISYL